MKFTCYVIVGDIGYPAETTCVSPDADVACEARKWMIYQGEWPDTVMYAPGEEVPEEVAEHVRHLIEGK